eukprot:10374360-Lingulodinium_polyedra.AAC.1
MSARLRSAWLWSMTRCTISKFIEQRLPRRRMSGWRSRIKASATSASKNREQGTSDPGTMSSARNNAARMS